MKRQIDINVTSTEDYYGTITISFGTNKIEDRFLIRCPNEDKKKKTHIITKNGHDTSVKGNPQQYHCTCGKNFYPHTSKVFEDLKSDVKTLINKILHKGRLDPKILSDVLPIKKSTAGRLLNLILLDIAENKNIPKDFTKKRRRSNSLFIDETFITINGKTWYLILVLSGNNKVMAFELVEKRSKEIMLKIIKDCESRLLYGLQVLYSDGFMVYKGVARDLGHDIIHVRHIHKPPYGRIEIDIYTYDEFDVTKTTAKTMNEITKVNGYFITQVFEKKESLGLRKRGRKPGTKNRSKKEIEAEKKDKEEKKNETNENNKKKKREKKKGVTHVFNHNKKEGRIDAVGGSSEVVEVALNKILKQFPDMYITTNLVEKEYSIIKKLIDFRGRRNPELWKKLIKAYFAIRDDPEILKKALKNINISFQMVNKILPSLISCEIGTT